MEPQIAMPEQSPTASYPAPPRVHWIILLGALIVLDAIATALDPKISLLILSGLFFGVWSIYFCLWIRKLNRRTDTVLLACAAFACFLLVSGVGPYTSQVVHLLMDLVRITEGVLWLLLIFGIRNELLQHYNEREPVGLRLGRIMTLFFSFYYFQYHLYPIAQFKKRQAQKTISNPGRTPLA